MSTLIFRPAQREDCLTIAALFQISSDGYADYVWSQYDCPGLSLLAIGEQRYRRENTAFSYQNCVLAEDGGRVVGMLHSFPIPRDSQPTPAADPVLRGPSELEIPGSLYISSLAIFPGFRGRRIGSRLLDVAHAKAAAEGLTSVSLICLEENQGALRLYQRNGYEEVDRRPIVPHPLIHASGDALLMKRPIVPSTSLPANETTEAALAA